MKKVLLIAFFFAIGLIVLGPETSKPMKGASSDPSTPTFNKEVVRILQQNCQACHHPGYIAPFPLIKYSDAKLYAPAIKDAILSRRMPPWKPLQGCGEFADARILPQDQIDTMVRWIDGGTPEGDPSDLPPPVQFSGGWGLGEPDLELKSPEPYILAPTGDDIYRCFVMPYQFPEDTFINAVEVLPEASAVVHHVLLFIDGKGDSLKLDAADPGPGYTSFGGPGFNPVGGLGGWVPGNTPRFAPKGIGIKIPKGSRIVMQVHYHRNGIEQHDQTRVGLHFSKEPVESEIHYMVLYNLGFYLKPGGNHQKVSASFKTPANTNIKVLGVTPHMHLLGKEAKMEAFLPNGDRACMLNIDNWEFKWQGTYTYKEPISIPGGTKFKYTAYYDNSSANLLNPNTPPKGVTWGEQTTDEMMIAFISYIFDKKTSTSAVHGAEPVDEIELDPAVHPHITMGGKDLLEQTKMKLSGSILSSSPTEMYNWAAGYSRKEMNILPWYQPANKDVPQHSCH